MRIRDWSSDVCSSDLGLAPLAAMNSFQQSYDCTKIRVELFFKEISCPSSNVSQTIGQEIGSFMSYTIFLSLNSVDFCNSYLRSERSEERRVGKECVSTCRSWWSPSHKKKKTKN